MHLKTSKGTFTINRLSSDLRSWNLCDLLRQRASNVDALTSTYMSMEFDDPSRRPEIDDLQKAILELQMGALACVAGDAQEAAHLPSPGRRGPDADPDPGSLSRRASSIPAAASPPPQVPLLYFQRGRPASFASHISGVELPAHRRDGEDG